MTDSKVRPAEEMAMALPCMKRLQASVWADMFPEAAIREIDVTADVLETWRAEAEAAGYQRALADVDRFLCAGTSHPQEDEFMLMLAHGIRAQFVDGSKG